MIPKERPTYIDVARRMPEFGKYLCGLAAMLGAMIDEMEHEAP